MFSLISDFLGDRGFDFLLVSTVGVALISSAAWCISRKLKGNAALRRCVLFAALVSCLALPIPVWFCSATGLAMVSIPIVHKEPRSATPEAVQMESNSVVVHPRSSADLRSVPAEPLTSGTVESAIDPIGDATVPRATNQSTVAPAPIDRDSQSAGSYAATQTSFHDAASMAIFVWGAGVTLMLARLAWNCWRVVQLRRASYPTTQEPLPQLLQECAVRLEMRDIPRLLLSRRAITPLAVGMGRSNIILPECLLGAISNDELRDILLHELAHIARGDQWIVLLQALARALYWPIPPVHAINRELQRAREEVCDNVVLGSRDAVSYGETLLHVARLLVKPCPLGVAVGIMGGEGQLERRIAGLLNPNRSRVTTTGRKASLTVVLAFITAGALLSLTRFAVSAAPDAPQANPPPPQSASASDADADAAKLAGRFSGRVTDLDGKPIEGARVFVLEWSQEFSQSPTAQVKADALPNRAKTDSDGHFEFDAPDMVFTDVDGLPTNQRCVVIATADGYGPDWRKITGRIPTWGIWVVRNPVDKTDLALQLAVDDVPIQGRLLDPDGRPLADARVRLTGLQIPQQRDLDTYIKFVTNDNSAWMSGPEFERSLSREIPLPGMTAETRTDADGRFTLSGLGRERLAELKVTAPGVVDTTVTVMTRDAPEVGTNRLHGKPMETTYGSKFTLQLKRGITVSGVVRDRDTKQPIAGMWVGWGLDPVNGLWSGEYSRTTDADGRFTITGLSPGAFESEKPGHVMAVSSPGILYQPATADVQENTEVMIECARGIPFRLKVVDEQGQPVLAEVTYREVQPNPLLPRNGFVYDGRWPVGRAAHRGDGIYEGFVLPGPGAILVKTPEHDGNRPAHVDPKAFFAPGRTKWTAQERITSYGTQDTLSTSQVWINQHDYTAIVLVNASQDSKPLELSATVFKDRPRRVSLVDPDGNPVTGVQTSGMTYHPWDTEPPLRSASFPLTGLNPDRTTRITFFEKNRKLIGILLARGDSETPYTVVMQPWGAVTGQLLDENGKPKKADFSLRDDSLLETNNDPDQGEHAEIEVDAEGRFRIERLVPGQRYSAKVYRGIGMYAGVAFENLIVGPGEVRDLGDIRTKPPVNVVGQ